MIYFCNSSISANTIINSTAHYVGGTNSASSLMTNPTQALFIKGASVGVTVTLQAAVVLTPLNQNITLTDADFIEVGTYTADIITSFPSLNGMWLRFHINNTTGADALVTCSLE
jgi:hypothetical protein